MRYSGWFTYVMWLESRNQKKKIKDASIDIFKQCVSDNRFYCCEAISTGSPTSVTQHAPHYVKCNIYFSLTRSNNTMGHFAFPRALFTRHWQIPAPAKRFENLDEYTDLWPNRDTITNSIWFVISLMSNPEIFQVKNSEQTNSTKVINSETSAFKSHIILITYGTKKVNKELLAARTISRVVFTALSAEERDEGEREELINSYTSVAFHALPATGTVCTKGTEHQIVNTSPQRVWIQTPQPWKENLASE